MHQINVDPKHIDPLKSVCRKSIFTLCLKVAHPCKSHDHEHQWADLVMTYLLKDKRKREHKVVRLVWEFDCLHFAWGTFQYVHMVLPVYRRKREHKFVRFVWDWLFWHFAQYISICPRHCLYTEGNVNINLWDLCETLIVYILYSTFQYIHMVLPVYKRKREHKFVRLVWDFDCLHFAQYISIHSHGIACIQTWCK